jgi:hypothetical protein
MLKERKKVELLLTISRRLLILMLIVTITLLFSYINRLESVDLVFTALF